MTLREKIEALLALEAKVTPGQWRGDYKYGILTDTEVSPEDNRGIVSWDYGWEHPNECNDKPFIAAIRNAAPYLLRLTLAAIELEAAREAHWVTGEDGSTRRLADAINGFQAAIAGAEVITRGDDQKSEGAR